MNELAAGEETAPARRSLVAALTHPYFQILVGALLDTTGEVLLKKGAGSVSTTGGLAHIVGYAPLASGWTWLGIVSYVLSLASWLHVLRFVPLSVAFPMINVVHVLVPLGASIFLHEHVSPKRWIGISLIICGVLAIVQPFTRAEQKL